MPSRILISAAHKSSGKTTVSIGLSAALAKQHAVQTFKKGPDYIDPLWLAQASGQPCHNLDFFTQSAEEIQRCFHQADAGADISLIEGNKGLHDGVSLDGSDSNAALAKLLHTPVILVIDSRGMTRGVAPIVQGFQGFDPDVNIAGVILNQVGGSRHEGKLRAALETYTDIPVLGAVSRNPALTLDERHLGLIPSNEMQDSQDWVQRICEQVEKEVDIPAIKEITASAPKLIQNDPISKQPPRHSTPIRIAIAQDAAFGFYYAGDLLALKQAGAELIPFSPLKDSSLPNADGMFIGGGFPETHMEALQANASMRSSIRRAIQNGLPCYAECGGLMYLARSLSWNDQTFEMAGVIEGDVRMHTRPIGRGYVKLEETQDCPWPISQSSDSEIPAHEFHHSSLHNLPENTRFAYKILRGHGIDGKRDGLVTYNLLASYAHFRDVENNHWAQRFIDFVQSKLSA